MNIVFRVDSSNIIGTGHIMRCLTLAHQFKLFGAKVVFISRTHKGNICNIIEEQGFKVHRLNISNKICNDKSVLHSSWLGVTFEEDAMETIKCIQNEKVDLLVVDHYAIDSRWEKKVKEVVPSIMVIDDLADRSHMADFLLDQNLYQDINTRYTNKLPNYCKKFLGPEFALLRQEFSLHQKKNQIIDKNKIKRILIFFGGSDPTNETEKVLKALKNMELSNIIIDVVVGQSNSKKEKIKQLCSKLKNGNFHCQINNMAELMSKSDFAIAAGGSFTWERYCIGLPGITIAVAENQIKLIEDAQLLGIDMYLGESKNVTVDLISEVVSRIIVSPFDILSMSQKAQTIVDGNGAIKIVKEIFKIRNGLNEITIAR
ncbi:UDP-2,4-diacetamido-2,4,6-trideoxy-beta-L-altropyranose hydrolase [Fictibacillus sp. 7GRE50]|uniref:UDP-2,4-diacetamido-2,4, 6-trideoxy-beta-L-altropyranose hydrolase n=1 Tax=Fictibacillus sp. 7GRE50 TaxID=2745878 RepID=UPI0018CF4D42|nr:UDP-2,4-diacetamido-2,4,6-trideoxy-beta-L-altropyranose hydrolase [Fictibacillus sp. 7GRE50]MBH0164041.1 UDP-2,4-diacetamido-2,4,6-trideoxy-beta-L-altropyranose hydrolase [Fictibacillus sp. 7GRE50]